MRPPNEYLSYLGLWHDEVREAGDIIDPRRGDGVPLTYEAIMARLQKMLQGKHFTSVIIQGHMRLDRLESIMLQSFVYLLGRVESGVLNHNDQPHECCYIFERRPLEVGAKRLVEYTSVHAHLHNCIMAQDFLQVIR